MPHSLRLLLILKADSADDSRFTSACGSNNGIPDWHPTFRTKSRSFLKIAWSLTPLRGILCHWSPVLWRSSEIIIARTVNGTGWWIAVEISSKCRAVVEFRSFSACWTCMSVLRQLHRLPVPWRIEFKLAVLIYNLQGAEWPVSAVPGGWLSAYHCRRPPTTSIVQRCYVRVSTNSHKSALSIIHRCWTASLEQPILLRLCASEVTLLEFRRLLKTHLFCWGLWHLWLLLLQRFISK